MGNTPVKIDPKGKKSRVINVAMNRGDEAK